MGRKTGLNGLHWLDCVELRIEPKDLKDAFLDFWQDCCRFKVAPDIAAIEKKSTGVTLVSALDDIRGVTIKDIKRTRASGSKTERFLSCQPFLAKKHVSINKDAKHKDICLSHISKITANQSHRFDDIADTLSDAIDIVYIVKQIVAVDNVTNDQSGKMAKLRQAMLERANIRR
jgi:predicted phage terminase large subunit-like protein